MVCRRDCFQQSIIHASSMDTTAAYINLISGWVFIFNFHWQMMVKDDPAKELIEAMDKYGLPQEQFVMLKEGEPMIFK